MQKPQSAVNLWTGIIGTVIFYTVAWLLKTTPHDFDIITDCFIILAPTAAGMILYDVCIIKVHHHPETGLEWNEYRKKLKTCWKNPDIYIKFIGLSLSLALIAFIYHAPLYRGEYYQPFFKFLSAYAHIIITVSLLYFILIHPAMKNPRDGFWHLGILIYPKAWKNINNTILKQHLFSLCIKIFFLPLMFVFFIHEWHTFENLVFEINNPHDFFRISTHLIFFLDVVLATIGYVFTLRLFNAHIRWPEMEWGGWLFCLMCYAPFNQVIFSEFIDYHDGLSWNHWLGPHPVLYIIWGSAILLCNLVYVFATVNFGLRFSNLTHRGICTHGAYALMKHPAYVSKNLSWWLMEIPFLAKTAWLAIQNSIFLILVNIIYLMRARYEEKMLRKDPVYIEYCAYISEHGLFARLKKQACRIFKRKPET